MRSDDDFLWGRAVMMLVGLVLLAILALQGCTGYCAPGGAALYCTDAAGQAIRCPATPDSTKADTVRR